MNVAEGQRDVDEHDDVTDDDGFNVAVALSVQFIFNAPLWAEGNGQVGVGIVLHETDESEIQKIKK